MELHSILPVSGTTFDLIVSLEAKLTKLKMELKPWQSKLDTHLKKCKPGVNYISDNEGNSGKTWFAHYYTSTNENGKVLNEEDFYEQYPTISTEEVVFLDFEEIDNKRQTWINEISKDFKGKIVVFYNEGNAIEKHQQKIIDEVIDDIKETFVASQVLETFTKGYKKLIQDEKNESRLLLKRSRDLLDECNEIVKKFT